MRYYTKSLPDTPVILSNGTRYTFPKFPDGRGYVSTEDEELIHSFGLLIGRGVGGVSEISKEAYDAALKKNATLKPSVKQSPRSLPPRAVNVPPPLPARQPNASRATVEEGKGKLNLSAPLAAIRGVWKPVPTRITK